jgi:hypothetical protein
MARRRKRRYRDEDEEELENRARRRKGRRRHGESDGDVAVAERSPSRPKPPVTCYQCAHLVVTRSFVKHVSQSWDRAIIFPTLTCFQQCWTLEDPDSVEDKASVSEYLVSGADTCPSFVRGYPRHHDW